MKTIRTFIFALVFALASASIALAQSPQITTTSLPNGTVGQSYTGTLTCTNCKGYVFGLPQGNNLPPGLGLTSASTPAGVIGGTPTSTGTYTFTIALFPSEGGPQAQTNLSITINAATAPPAITTSTLPNGVVNVGYSAQLTCSNCTNYTWAVTSGNPPAGISLSSGGAFSGAPTAAGTSSFQVTLYPPSQFISEGGVRSQSVTAGFSITVSASALLITTANIPPAFQGTAYSTTLSAIGGDSAYTWSLSSTGSDGLTIGATTGIIGGTPMATGQFTLVVTVNDGSGSTATKNFVLTVAAGLSILNTSFPNGAAGTVYPTQTLSTGGGQPPYRWSVSAGALPPGLTLDGVFGRISGTPTVNGTYPFTLTVTDNAGSTASAMLSITVGQTVPTVQPTQLSFTAIAGGNAPAFQLISITPPGTTSKAFSVTVVGAPTWLTVSPTAGTAPGALVVTVNQAGLSASTTPYTATIQVTPGSGQTPIPVAVTLTVAAAPPMLTASPAFLKFAARVQSPGSQEQGVLLQNAGGGGALTLSAIVVGNSPWISAALSASQTGPNAPVLLRVTINSQGLSVGSHHDIVRVTYSGGTLDVPVSLFVANSGAILGVSLTGVRFPALQGAGSSEVQTVNVLDLGGQGTSLNWTATVQSGANWLNVTPATGTASPGSPGKLSLSPGSAAATLPVGGSYALVQVAATGALNSPQFITAVLDVSPSTVSVTPELQPTGLFFTAVAGGAATATQPVAVYASSTTAVPFGFNATTSDGATWLVATSSTASASTPNPGQVLVSVNPAPLVAAGIYHGTVNVAMNGALRGVSVTVVVTAGAGGKGQIEPATTAGCTPNGIAITPVGLVNYFSISAGWPAQLIAQLNDSCGNPLSTASVSASFSNGDPPLSLAGDGVSNTYAASWQPGSVNPEMTVTVAALADPLPQATAVFLGGVNPNAASPPVLSPNAVYNIFFTPGLANALGAGLPPGTVAQLYGTGLATQADAPKNVPLPNQFDGTFVAIGGYFAPIFYVSGTQLNVEVPNELTPNSQYPVYISVNGALTLPQTIDVPVLQPGMVTYPDGSAIAQHGNGTLITSSSPALPGEAIAIYLAGMGPTNVMVPSGQPTPTTQLDLVSTQPTITVGGQNATVTFAGLVPGGIGLYQINFVVPPGLSAGTLPLTVTQNSVAANTAQLIVGSSH